MSNLASHPGESSGFTGDAPVGVVGPVRRPCGLSIPPVRCLEHSATPVCLLRCGGDPLRTQGPQGLLPVLCRGHGVLCESTSTAGSERTLFSGSWNSPPLDTFMLGDLVAGYGSDSDSEEDAEQGEEVKEAPAQPKADPPRDSAADAAGAPGVAFSHASSPRCAAEHMSTTQHHSEMALIWHRVSGPSSPSATAQAETPERLGHDGSDLKLGKARERPPPSTGGRGWHALP